MRTAHRNAGSPSFTLLDARNVLAGRGTLAKSTLSRILTPDPTAKDQSLPAWSYYEGLLYALGVDPALFQLQWQAAQEEWQARARGETATLPVVLVTAKPPKTLTGKIVRTWNQDANNGRGGSIGVLVFPTPYALNGSNGPHHDGDIVEVVCHTAHGRLIHERLDTNRVNSTGWFEIYYLDRLWWVPDRYISVDGEVPDCG